MGLDLSSPYTRASLGIVAICLVFWAILAWLPYVLAGDAA